MASAYSPDQVHAYLRHIRLPLSYYPDGDDSRLPTPSHRLLHALHVLQISTIPHESLSMHYSPTKTVDVAPASLLGKIMSGRGRGGYCIENTVFFHHVLRRLGFRVYMTGARVRLRRDGVPQGEYIGLTHTLNVVALPPTPENPSGRYVVDVSFGGDGPVRPLPMVPGRVVRNIGSQQLRLLHEPVAGMQDPDQRWWIYQYRNAADRDWLSFYCFSETEFTEWDFRIMNLYTSGKESFLSWTVVVVKFLRRDGSTSEVEYEDGGGGEGTRREDTRDLEIYGKRMLVNDVVKVNTGGRTEIVAVCQGEETRIGALDKWFDIQLTDEEKAGIRGYGTELKGS